MMILHLPVIKCISLLENRFTTLGDWMETAPGEFMITVTEMVDWRHETLVLLHELVEWAICQRDGVRTADCDAFDALWEQELRNGLQRPETEAGFDRRCPYRKGHVWGCRVERAFAFLFGVSWADYCRTCDEMIAEYDEAATAAS